MEHSKVFGFSSAHRWANCSGAPKLCKDAPDLPDDSAMEGEAAHWVGEQMLAAFKLGVDGLPIGQMCIGKKAPNGVIVIDEMYDGAIVYYNAITAIVPWEKRGELEIELKVKAHHTLDPEAWGTADAIYYDASTNTLYIWDFKFGHYSVKAFQNFQLVGYAIAAMETMKLEKLNPRLNLNIVQPRCYDGQGPIRNWTCGVDDLRGNRNKMEHAIYDHRSNNGKLTTGEWCRECPGRHMCPSLLQATAQAIDYTTKGIPNQMTGEALSYELSLLEIAEARIKQRKIGLEAEAEARVRKGELIPGRVMQDTIGQRAWSCPPEHVYMLGETFGLDFHAEQKPVTVAKAEEALKRKGVDVSVINPYYHKPKTGVKLVADDLSRASQLFSQEKFKQ